MEVETKRKVVPLKFIYQLAKFGNFLSHGSNLFIFYKMEHVWILENTWNK
jgi:hypothetical protein